MMRDGFRDVVAGWMLIDDVYAFKAKIDLAAVWTAAHGPLNSDEESTVKLMIASFCRKGIRDGKFTAGALLNFLERHQS
jgi:hypothetical protein